jgi:hypothetical protein
MDFNHDTGTISSGLQFLNASTTPPAGGTAGVLTITGTGALVTTVGTTAQRPTASSFTGGIRWNTDNVAMEFSNGTAWTNFGSVTSVAVTGSTGLTVGSSPVTTSGTITLTLGTELQGLSGLSTTGILARTGAGTYSPRTIAGTGSNITVTNGDGVAGAPTIDLTTVAQGSTGTSFVKVQLDTKGRVINNTAVTTADITALVDAAYVNATGDSMSGDLTFDGTHTVKNIPTPATGTDAANKNYVDAAVQGLTWKSSVRAATTVAGTLASSFANGSTVDGITLATGDRILIKNQATGSENGIYTVNSAGAPTRAVDADLGTEVAGAAVYVDQGTVNADTAWTMTTAAPITIGSTALTWAQFSGGGSSYTNGTGLTLTGNVFSLTAPVTVGLGGTGTASTPSNGQLLIGNGSTYTLAALTQGTGMTITNGAGSITVTNAGVTSLAGTSNQITASTSTGAVTLSLPAAVTLGTSLTISGLNANSFLYSGTAGLLTAPTAPTNGQLLIGSTGAAPAVAALTQGTGITITNGAGTITIANSGVTSVAVSGGTTGLTTSGGPITTTGTITLTGTLIAANGGTGLSSLGSGNQILSVNTGATALEYRTVTAGTGISVTPATGTLTIANTGVTSVALSLPSFITVTGSPVTTTGTLTGTLASQTANTFFVAPNGSAGAPTFRAIVAADLPLTLYRESSSSPTTPTASGTNTLALGSGAQATGTGTLALGSGSLAQGFGTQAFANGAFTANGDAQGIMVVLRNITTDGTATELFLDGTAATQRLAVPSNSCITFSILLAARRTDTTGGSSGYEFQGVLIRNTTNSSTAFVGTPTKAVLGETNAAWDAAISADTTNGSLKITVTGEAAKTIRWVATVNAALVTN